MLPTPVREIKVNEANVAILGIIGPKAARSKNIVAKIDSGGQYHQSQQ